ncbi:MAG TPA: OmpA family protein [Syntrophales bacterium]|nr:OmpA family protein [Syntrophales bacterium]
MKKNLLITMYVSVALVGCTAGYTSIKADYSCPVPPTFPVEEKTVAVAPPVVVTPPVAVTPPAPEKVPAQKIEVYPFYFDFDKSDPSKNTMATEAAIKALNADKAKTAELQGNCDRLGSAAYNMKLGDRRAKAVKALLVKSGIEEKRLTTVSYGKAKAKGKTEKERSLDRRVDIVIK